MKRLIFLIMTCLMSGSLAFAALTEIQKITALIQVVEKSDIVFIRNGTEYPGVEAAQHLQNKLNSAITSPFAPKRSDWTAIMFIEKIGTKSSASGKEYQVKTKDGNLYKSSVWLTQQLKTIEAANP